MTDLPIFGMLILLTMPSALIYIFCVMVLKWKKENSSFIAVLVPPVAFTIVLILWPSIGSVDPLAPKSMVIIFILIGAILHSVLSCIGWAIAKFGISRIWR